MSVSRPVPSRSGGTAPTQRRSFLGIGFALAVLVLLVASALLGPGATGGSAALPGTSGAHAAASTYGDLIVAPGQTVTIQSPSPGGTYYQGGNITVEAGGTLIVENTTISFVQFVTNGNSLAVQFSHIFRLNDAGTVDFIDSGITADTNVQNFSAKIFVSVTGTLTAWDSTFAFPGWVQVSGAGASATFNDSLIERDLAIPIDLQVPSNGPSDLLADQAFAPVLNVTDGGELSLLGSDYLNTYSDNWTANGGVGAPPPITATGLSLPTTGATFPAADFALPNNDPLTVAEAALYPSEVSAVTVSITYAAGTGNAAVGIDYGGTTYHIGTASFAAGTGTDTLTAGVGSALVAAMMNSGAPFDSNQSVVFSAVTATGAVTISQIQITLTPDPSFNITAWGAGSRFNAVNSLIDLNFEPSYANTSVGSPINPWNSNKLEVYDDAEAFLANVTFVQPYPANFSTSAVLTDGTGQVYLYRWASFDLEGQDQIHVADAQLSPFYAYDSNQLSNATANAANALSTASPAIWGYVNYWDGLHGVPSYGTSNVAGQAWLLLADSQVTGTSIPDGNYLGNYHVGISLPNTGIPTVWVYAAVSPYPQGVANGTPGFGLPDAQPLTTVTGYYGAATLQAPVILANGTAAPAGSVREGQELGVQLTLVDAGTARIFNINASLFWNQSGAFGALSNFTASDLNLTAVGQTYTFTLSWVVNDSVTGLMGNFTHGFYVALSWNYGQQQYAGGSLALNASVVIAPSTIVIVSLVPPTSPLDTSNAYVTTGVIAYNGTQPAVIFITATPVGGGTPIQIASGSSFAGKFEVYWSSRLSSLLSPGTTYYLKATATYNGATTTYLFPGTYSVPSTTSATGFLFEKFLGLPLWLWLVIAAAIVIAIVAVLLLFRRQAAGKLVECGECGELIPADATVCPKCGAEFENDLVRCSRCSSTIPANSQYCPECGAQLLGTPGEGASDPERQAYADFTERFRAEAKKELGDNYTESAFWDWWKRQPTYVPFSQWKAQQSQGAPRTGMSQPPAGSEVAPTAGPGGSPPRGGAGMAPPPGAGATPAPAAAPSAPPSGASAATSGLKPCPSCGKEIPPEYLVCPFCGAVTQ